jgi:hypothetical protein
LKTVVDTPFEGLLDSHASPLSKIKLIQMVDKSFMKNILFTVNEGKFS